MSLNTLPPELITHIYSFLEPSSHLVFALTDRQIAYNSRDILAYHQKCATLYRFISDADPSFLTTAILHIHKDPIAAWHVRHASLLWKSDVNNIRASMWSFAEITPTQPSLYFKAQRMPLEESADLEMLKRTVFDKLLSLGVLTKRPTEDPLRVRALILAVSTSIKSLTLATLGPRMLTSDEIQAISNGQDVALDSISQLIQNMHDRPQWQLIPGFESLRSIAVGVKAGRACRCTKRKCRVDFKDFAPVLLLPNIETVYVRDLVFLDAGADDLGALRTYSSRLPRNTTKLKHLFLEEADLHPAFHYESYEVLLGLLAAPRELRSIAFKNCVAIELDRIVTHLSKTQSSSLEHLIYITDGVVPPGSRNHNFRGFTAIGGGALTNFECLRTLCIGSFGLLPIEQSVRGSMSGYSSQHTTDGGGRPVQDLAALLPSSVETLVLGRLWLNRWDDDLTIETIEGLDDEFSRLIANRCANATSGTGGQYNFKALYLEDLDKETASGRTRLQRTGHRLGRTAFPKAEASALAHGVELLDRRDVGLTEKLFKNVLGRAYAFMGEHAPF